MNPSELGYTEKPYRPWPKGAEFLEMSTTPKWVDLYHKAPDDRIIYLASRPSQ